MSRYLLLFFITLTSFIEATHTYGNLIVQEVVGVHDGDTFKVNIDGVHPIIGHAVPIRIWGIDAPEITSKDPQLKKIAIEARDYIARRLHDSNLIELINIQRDKYFRILAEVYLDGSCLGDELIQNGLAKPYFGGHKE